MPNPPPHDIPRGKNVPPGARWITVHPKGAESAGHPVLISKDGVVLGGMGGVHNGRHLNDLYRANPGAWNATGGDARVFALPDYLNYWEPNAAQRKAFEHWGPEFDVGFADHPEYEGGRWRAHISNPHLENAVKAGYIHTPSGVTLAAHPEGGVTYQGYLQHPGRSGFTAFGSGMHRDVVNHIANYLAGEHEKRVPKGFLQRPIFFKPKKRVTAEERAPTAEAPWGYDVSGRKLMRSDPKDPLADPNWAPRPDLLAKGRGRQPRAPTFTDLGGTTNPPPAGLSAHREEEAPPAAEVGSAPQPPAGEATPEPSQASESRQAPEDELRSLFREREEAAWHANHVAEQAQHDGRTLSPEEQAEVEEAGSRIQAHGERLRALAGEQGWTSDDVRGLLGLDEEPESEPASAAQPEPEPEQVDATSAQGGAAPSFWEGGWEQAAEELAGEQPAAEEPPTAPPTQAPVQPQQLEQPQRPAPPARAKEPTSGSPEVMAQHQDWRTSGGMIHQDEPKSAGVPAEKSGGAEPEPDDEDLEAGWARWEAEQAAKQGGSRADLEREAAELGVSPEELEEYRQDYEKEAQAYSGKQGQLEWANRLEAAIRDRGQISASAHGKGEWERLPRWAKNKNSQHTLDTIVDDLRDAHPEFWFEDPNELQDALERAAAIHEDSGRRVLGRRTAKSRAELERDRWRKNAERRDQRALRKQGGAPVRRTTGVERDVRLAADPNEPAGGEPMDSPSAGARYELGDDDYAVPGKRLLPIFSALSARRSWDALDRTSDLSADERKEAEARILDALHIFGLPEHEAPPELPAAGAEDEAGDGDDDAAEGPVQARAEAPAEASVEGGPDDGTEPGMGSLASGPEEDGAETNQEKDQQMGKQRIPPEVVAEAKREGETPEHEMEEKESGTEYGPADLKEDAARAARAAATDEDDEEDDEDDEDVREAVLDADARDDLADSKFACPELGKLPIHDAAHVRNAMARFNQTQGLSPEQKKSAWRRITRAAKRFGVSVSPDQRQNNEDVREAEPVRIPNRIPVQFMSVGHGNRRDGHFYTEDAVRNLVDCVRQQPKMFISHSDQSQVQRHGHRPLEQLGAVAVRESVHYDPVRRATVGEVVLRPAMREFVETAHQAGDTIGISVDGKGLFRPGTKECVGWSQFYSADFVPRGGAGGFTLAVRESERPDLAEEEKEFVKVSLLDSLSTQDVREGNPALFEAIGREYATANPVTETVREADTTEVERLVRENETLTSERDQAMARLDELEADRNREQVARFVDQLVRECGVEQGPQVAYIAKLFAGATCGPRGTYQTRDELEGAVRETTQEYLSTLPPAPPSGEIVGQGATRGEAMQQTEGWTNPFNVINDGMAMLWGHEPERKSPAKNGAVAS